MGALDCSFTFFRPSNTPLKFLESFGGSPEVAEIVAPVALAAAAVGKLGRVQVAFWPGLGSFEVLRLGGPGAAPFRDDHGPGAAKQEKRPATGPIVTPVVRKPPNTVLDVPHHESIL